MVEWPRRYVGPFQKVKAHKDKRGKRPKGPTAIRRAKKRAIVKRTELTAMLDARDRDGYCRFPLCGCVRKGRLWAGRDQIAEVSHAKHRGMGGNPEGDRTVPALLLLVCNWRHKLSKLSIDQKTIRWVPLTPDGANGPIRWLVPLREMVSKVFDYDGPVEYDAGDRFSWVELARETAPHEYEPFTDAQKMLLSYLSEMSC